MIEMVYFNKDISSQEADKLVKRGLELRHGLYDKLLANAETIKDAKQRGDYISACLPFIAMI